jgi:hypothetical protein
MKTIMNSKHKYAMGILLFLVCFGNLQLQAQSYKDCYLKNKSTKKNEQITFKVYYTFAGAWIGAGVATFTNKLETYKGKPVYHIVGDGKTLRSYDWFFKVRDKYESYIDTATMLPYKFVRRVNEGGYKKYNVVNFNRRLNSASSNAGVKKVPACVHDVVSAIYYARNIDFNKYKKGDKIPFSIFLDNKVYNIYIRYLGKVKLTTKHGVFRCIKFKPLLIDGTIFDGGEKMTVWITDDDNKIPIHVETPIIVGKVRIDMVKYKNLRNPTKGILKMYK